MYDYEIEKHYHPENFEIQTDEDSVPESNCFESEYDPDL